MDSDQPYRGRPEVVSQGPDVWLREIFGTTVRIEKKIRGVPSDLDWVKAYAGCLISKAFERLKTEIERDVKARNDQRGSAPYYVFSLVIGEQGSFMVTLSGNAIQQTVTFRQSENFIAAEDSDGRLICKAAPTLSEDGQCRLTIEGKEREFWQFRRLALENLFFDSGLK